MSIQRGLFRLWVILAVVFTIATAAVSSRAIRNEFFWSDPPKELAWRLEVPINCEQARGTAGTDYSTFEGLCWYGNRSSGHSIPSIAT